MRGKDEMPTCHDMLADALFLGVPNLFDFLSM
jgi:hypothetical protein